MPSNAGAVASISPKPNGPKKREIECALGDGRCWCIVHVDLRAQWGGRVPAASSSTIPPSACLRNEDEIGVQALRRLRSSSRHYVKRIRSASRAFCARAPCSLLFTSGLAERKETWARMATLPSFALPLHIYLPIFSPPLIPRGPLETVQATAAACAFLLSPPPWCLAHSKGTHYASALNRCIAVCASDVAC